MEIYLHPSQYTIIAGTETLPPPFYPSKINKQINMKERKKERSRNIINIMLNCQ
jgi:hypothetical protein